MSDYLTNAESELGATKSQVQPYLQQGGFGQLAAWCAAFVSSRLAQAGYSVAPGDANVASNYLNYGTSDRTPQYGDVAINTASYQPGGGIVSPGQTGGHVGFVDSVNADGSVNIIAGNTGGNGGQVQMMNNIQPGGSWQFVTPPGLQPGGSIASLYPTGQSPGDTASDYAQDYPGAAAGMSQVDSSGNPLPSPVGNVDPSTFPGGGAMPGVMGQILGGSGGGGNLLNAFAGIAGKIEYVASLRDTASGAYSHWGLTRAYGEPAAQHALAEAHRLVFLGLLRTPLRALRDDVIVSSGVLQITADEYVERLRNCAPALLPPDLGGGSARHFSSVLQALSILLSEPVKTPSEPIPPA